MKLAVVINLIFASLSFAQWVTTPDKFHYEIGVTALTGNKTSLKLERESLAKVIDNESNKSGSEVYFIVDLSRNLRLKYSYLSGIRNSLELDPADQNLQQVIFYDKEFQDSQENIQVDLSAKSSCLQAYGPIVDIHAISVRPMILFESWNSSVHAESPKKTTVDYSKNFPVFGIGVLLAYETSTKLEFETAYSFGNSSNGVMFDGSFGARKLLQDLNLFKKYNVSALAYFGYKYKRINLGTEYEITNWVRIDGPYVRLGLEF